MLSSIPLQLLLLFPLHLAEKFNPGAFNKKLVTNVKLELNKSKSSPQVCNASQLLWDLDEVEQDADEDVQDEDDEGQSNLVFENGSRI